MRWTIFEPLLITTSFRTKNWLLLILESTASELQAELKTKIEAEGKNREAAFIQQTNVIEQFEVQSPFKSSA